MVYVDFTTDRIELWSSSDGVEPDPVKGLWAAVLVRDASGWRQHTTLPDRRLVDIAAFKRRKRADSTRTARMPSSIACKSAPVNWPLSPAGPFQQSLNEGTAGSHRHPALEPHAPALQASG